ncbi:MAG: hypothetical protein MHM6MM_008861 [Cercozoa sp. M6MM]
MLLLTVLSLLLATLSVSVNANDSDKRVSAKVEAKSTKLRQDVVQFLSEHPLCFTNPIRDVLPEHYGLNPVAVAQWATLLMRTLPRHADYKTIGILSGLSPACVDSLYTCLRTRNVIPRINCGLMAHHFRDAHAVRWLLGHPERAPQGLTMDDLRLEYDHMAETALVSLASWMIFDTDGSPGLNLRHQMQQYLVAQEAYITRSGGGVVLDPTSLLLFSGQPPSQCFNATNDCALLTRLRQCSTAADYPALLTQLPPCAAAPAATAAEAPPPPRMFHFETG